MVQRALLAVIDPHFHPPFISTLSSLSHTISFAPSGFSSIGVCSSYVHTFALRYPCTARHHLQLRQPARVPGRGVRRPGRQLLPVKPHNGPRRRGVARRTGGGGGWMFGEEGGARVWKEAGSELPCSCLTLLGRRIFPKCFPQTKPCEPGSVESCTCLFHCPPPYCFFADWPVRLLASPLLCAGDHTSRDPAPLRGKGLRS